MAKPSEKYSIVPEMLRDKFREYKKKERMEDKMEGEGMEGGPGEQDREALKNLIEAGNGNPSKTHLNEF